MILDTYFKELIFDFSEFSGFTLVFKILIYFLASYYCFNWLL